MPSRQPLSPVWVDRIFDRLTVAYGHLFLGRWSGIDLTIVKADWAEKLGGMSGDEVRKALDSIPADNPPTAMQFRALGYIPAAHMPALPPPPPSRSGLKRIATELTALRNSKPVTRRELVARFEAKARNGGLTAAQREWLNAASQDDAPGVIVGPGSVIEPHLLPPGMRAEMGYA